MRKLWKSLAVLLVVAMVLTSVAVLTASAATPEKLYLTPSANWKQSNARFAAYFFGNGEKWISMTDPDGDGVKESKMSGLVIGIISTVLVVGAIAILAYAFMPKKDSGNKR